MKFNLFKLISYEDIKRVLYLKKKNIFICDFDFIKNSANFQ